jgi:hypothetical protein
MPWRLAKTVILILLGVTVLVLAIVIFILNQNTSSDLLAVVGLIGGLAIIVNSLPSNGEAGH